MVSWAFSASMVTESIEENMESSASSLDSSLKAASCSEIVDEADDDEEILLGMNVEGEAGLLPPLVLPLKGTVTSAAIEGGDAFEDARSEDALRDAKKYETQLHF